MYNSTYLCWSNYCSKRSRPFTPFQDTLRNAFYYWRFAACAYGWKLLNGFFFQDKERNLLLGLVQGDNKNMTVLCEHCELEQSDIVCCNCGLMLVAAAAYSSIAVLGGCVLEQHGL